MEFGYPGANTTLENHGVSEESFWPSFTDIMMVIVMVFLLVTVAVILNNWSLIGDLKNSIQAQKLASTLAESTQVKNDSLGSKLTALEKQIVIINEKYEQEKANLLSTQTTLEANQKALEANQIALSENETKLSETLKIVTEKDNELQALQTQLQTLNDDLAKEKSNFNEAQQQLTLNQQQLSEKETTLQKLQTDLTDAVKQKDELTELNKAHNNTIAENEKEQQALREELNTSKSTIATLEDKQKATIQEIDALKKSDEIKTQVLASLQTDRSKLEETVSSLKSDYASSQEATKNEIALAKEIKLKLEAAEQAREKQKTTLLAATDSEKLTKDALNEAQQALKELEEEKQRIIETMSEKLVETETKVTNLEASIEEINEQVKARDTELFALKDNPQLRSLQGKYDVLDAKYKKLLRPARSSKGKFVVSVTYKKKGGKKIIRLKPSPTGSYKTVSEKQLNTELTKLKAKHKKDLYMKVIIPETSGLSYSEAWKFTSNLQKKYDYYHQPDDSQ